MLLSYLEELLNAPIIGPLLVVSALFSYFGFNEPLAKFIERGEFSLCSRGGAAGAQAGAGLSCVTRSI